MRFLSVAAWLVSWEVQVPFVLCPGLSSRPCCPGCPIRLQERRKRRLEVPRLWAGPITGRGGGLRGEAGPFPVVRAQSPPECQAAARWGSRAGLLGRQGGSELHGTPGTESPVFTPSRALQLWFVWASAVRSQQKGFVRRPHPSPARDQIGWKGGAGSGPKGAARDFQPVFFFFES